MRLQRGKAALGFGVLLPLLGMLVALDASALSDADVANLKNKCEAEREKALAPIREQRTLECIAQQLRSPDHCKRYYQTYGNVSPGPGRAPVSGYFYDLPECMAWLNARDALRVSRSRN